MRTRSLLLALAVVLGGAVACGDDGDRPGAAGGTVREADDDPAIDPGGDDDASGGLAGLPGCAGAPGPGRYVVTAAGSDLQVSDAAGAPVDVAVRGLPADDEDRAALIAALGADRRTIRVVVPAGDGPHDVVLDFHGYSSNAAHQLTYSRLGEVAADAGYLVVAIDGRDQPRRWELASTDPELSAASTSDVAVVDAATDVVLDTFCGDPDGIHAAGMSNGSVFAAVLACHSDHDVRAVASVAFTTGTAGCDDDRQIPTIAIHGTADVVVPYSGRDVPLIEAVLDWSLEPAEDAMAIKAALNGCDGADDETVGADVLRRTWRDCEAATVLYRIDGGGHGWPGPVQPASGFGRSTTTIDATQLVVDFFDEH